MTKQAADKNEKDKTVTVEQTTENNCDVEQTRKDLSDLYKNVTMAQNCVKTLLPYVDKQELTKALHKQVEQYNHYVEQIGTLAENLNFDPTPAPKMLIGMANMGIRAKMMGDKSVTHVAKVMLQGTLNGIIDLYRMTRNNNNTHPDVALLSKQILHYEEGCFENMKSYL